MKYIASVSFGKDSLAMLLMLIEKDYPLDEVIFFDTGMEFQAIYNIRDKTKSLLESKNIKYTELQMDKPFEWYMIKKPKRTGDIGYKWCGGPCRWATTFKTVAIKKYYKAIDDIIIEYVGIASDEKQRIKRKRLDTVKLYPLVEWGMTENDCLVYCTKKGFKWLEDAGNGIVDLYEQLDRVSCWCCQNNNLSELKNIYKNMPNYWSKLKDLQANIDIPYKGKGKSVEELEEIFTKEK